MVWWHISMGVGFLLGAVGMTISLWPGWSVALSKGLSFGVGVVGATAVLCLLDRGRK